MQPRKAQANRAVIDVPDGLLDALWRAIHHLEDRAESFSRFTEATTPSGSQPDWAGVAADDLSAATELRSLAAQIPSRG